MVVIVPRSGTVFDENTLRVVKQLTDDAWKTPFSLRVDSITNFQHTQAVADDLLVEDLLLDASTLSPEKVKQIQQAALAERAAKAEALYSQPISVISSSGGITNLVYI